MSQFSIPNPSPSIQTWLADHILTVTFARGSKKNALTLDMYTALNEILLAAELNKNVRALIIAGHSEYFTAGNDISDFLNNPPKDESSPVLAFLRSLSSYPKPLIAAANGVAVGIGTTILLHCDFVILHPEAVLKLPFVELGLCPEAASSLLLPRQIGYLRAAEMILSNASIIATQALDWGLANKVAEDPLAEAQMIAQLIASQPLASLILSKQLLKREIQPLMAERLTLEGGEFVKRLASPEAREAFTAFVEKRKPDFKQF